MGERYEEGKKRRQRLSRSSPMAFHSVLDLRHNGAVMTLGGCQELGTIGLLLECVGLGVGSAYYSNLELYDKYNRNRGPHNSLARGQI